MTFAISRILSESIPSYLAIPDSRAAAIRRLDRELVPGRRVALSTHMNADGDGCGSESALARLLAGNVPVELIKNTRIPVLLLPPDWAGTI